MSPAGQCRAEGQPCPCPVPALCPLSPASGQPRTEQRLPKAFVAADRAVPFLIGATRSVTPAGSGCLGGGSREVLDPSQQVQGGRYSSATAAGLGVPSLGTEGGFGGSGEANPEVGDFPRLGDEAVLPPEDKPHGFPSAQSWRRGSGARVLEEGWAPCGSMPGCTLTIPSSGALC